MSVDTRWGIAPQRRAQGRWPCADVILFAWPMRLPIHLDPSDAACTMLMGVPARRRETSSRSRLRGLPVALIRGEPSASARSSSG